MLNNWKINMRLNLKEILEIEQQGSILTERQNLLNVKTTLKTLKLTERQNNCAAGFDTYWTSKLTER